MSKLRAEFIKFLSELDGVDPEKHPQVKAGLDKLNEKDSNGFRLKISSTHKNSRELADTIATLFHLYPDLQTEKNTRKITEYEKAARNAVGEENKAKKESAPTPTKTKNHTSRR